MSFPLLLFALNIFDVGEFSNGSVNLLFTFINKIRYKLLQYKLPCSGPPLTSAINDKDPSFSQLQESSVSRAKFKPANVLTETSVWIFLTAGLVAHCSGPGAHACDVRERCSWTYTWRVPQTPPAAGWAWMHLHPFPEVKEQVTCTFSEGLDREGHACTTF